MQSALSLTTDDEDAILFVNPSIFNINPVYFDWVTSMNGLGERWCRRNLQKKCRMTTSPKQPNMQPDSVSLKIRNGIITVAMIAVLLGPTGAFVAQKLQIELPSWATAADADLLRGNNAKRQALNIDRIFADLKDKTFQTTLETTIAEHTPFQAIALLDNAAIQRSFIVLSNALFDWECYPTFYGSNMVYAPRPDALFAMPLAIGDYGEDAAIAYANGLQTLANANPQIEFNVFVANKFENVDGPP